MAEQSDNNQAFGQKFLLLYSTWDKPATARTALRGCTVPRLPSSAPSRSILPITLLPNPLRYDGHKAMMLSFAYQRLASPTDTQPSSLAVFSSVSCPLSDSVIAQRSPAMQPRLVRDLEVLVTATAIYWLPLTQ